MHWSRLVVVLAVVSSVLVATPSNAASPGVPLPFDMLYRMVVDPADDLVAMSGGPGSTELVVADTDATGYTTLNLLGASGMAMVGTDLYLSETDASRIAVVDMTADPPAVDRTISIGTFTNPDDMAFVNGRLWFFTDSGLASMLPDGSGLRGPFDVGPYFNPFFVDGLSEGSVLASFEASLSPTTIFQYTAGLPPRWLGDRRDPARSSNAFQMSMLPGGAKIVISAGAPYAFSEVRTSDGTKLRSYLARPYTQGVATTAAHGGLIAGALTDVLIGDEILLYRTGHIDPFLGYDLHDDFPDRHVVPRGIAWDGDGERLLTVVGTDPYGADPIYVPITMPGLPTQQTAEMTLEPSASRVGRGERIDLTAHLEGGAPGAQVVVTVQPFGKPEHLVMAGPVDPDGDLRVSNVRIPRSSMLTASFAGDDDWGSAESAVRAFVRSKTSMELLNPAGRAGHFLTFPRGKNIVLHGRVAPHVPDGPAEVEVQVNEGSGWMPELSHQWWYEKAGYTGYWIKPLSAGSLFRVRLVSGWAREYIGSSSSWRYFRYIA